MRPSIFEFYFSLSMRKLKLLSMAVQGGTCNRGKIDLKQMLQSIKNEESKSEGTGKPLKFMSQDALTIINGELSKLLTPNETKHAMKILRGFSESATDIEKDAALVSFESIRKIGFGVSR